MSFFLPIMPKHILDNAKLAGTGGLQSESPAPGIGTPTISPNYHTGFSVEATPTMPGGTFPTEETYQNVGVGYRQIPAGMRADLGPWHPWAGGNEGVPDYGQTRPEGYPPLGVAPGLMMGLLPLLMQSMKGSKKGK